MCTKAYFTIKNMKTRFKLSSERNEAKLNGSVTISFVFDRTNPGQHTMRATLRVGAKKYLDSTRNRRWRTGCVFVSAPIKATIFSPLACASTSHTFTYLATYDIRTIVPRTLNRHTAFLIVYFPSVSGDHPGSEICPYTLAEFGYGTLSAHVSTCISQMFLRVFFSVWATSEVHHSPWIPDLQ